MTLKVLKIKEAAELIQVTIPALRQLARDGKVPAKKIGSWRFIEGDLIDYLRSDYGKQKLKGGVWRSKKEKASGISDLQSADKEYNARLGLRTGKRLSS